MNTDLKTDRRANLIGSLWMVLAMGCFAVEDVFVKAAAAQLPIGEILILFGAGGALVFASAAFLNREPLYSPEVVSTPMRIRVFFEIIGRLFYILAISLTPLSSATVILQAASLVLVAGAAIVFGEKVGWRRWVAIFIGLAGVIVIIRPGTESFSMLSILAIIGMLGFAGRDLASRAAPASLSTSILGLYGFLAVVAAGALFSLWDGKAFLMPSAPTMLYLSGAVFCGFVAYSGLMKAMRTGEVSAVAPFRYTRLLFGIGFGVLLFDETLSASMLVGSGLIVLSGLFVLWRSKQASNKT